MSGNNPVYIKHLSYANMGPISFLEIEAPFDKEGRPKPIVLVGENGSGKSTVLSNITDSFLEIAGEAFEDALERKGLGHQYFKAINSQQIKIGSSYQTARIDFTNEKSYLFKSGNLAFEKYQESNKSVNSDLSWGNEVNSKKHTFSKEEAESLFENQVICSFLSSRYEKPSWMGESYYRPQNNIGPSIKGRIAGQTRNRVLVDECKDETLQWLLDILVDSRTDIKESSGGLEIAHNPNVNNTLLFGRARLGIERILSSILGESVYFDIGYRNEGASRFRIRSEADGNIVCPSFDSLSTGQIILFELFSTIIRYADNNDVSKSLHLEQIEGIVVIDEIDLHLHVSLQKEVLPKLIKMFPKVQFIFSTHSPLLLLGLERELGPDECLFIELPFGDIVAPESYREFDAAYKTYASTRMYLEDIRSQLQRNNSMPLIVTEGTTDWRILERIQRELEATNSDLFVRQFNYFKYGSNKDDSCEFVCEMGSKRLRTLCQALASLPAPWHGTIIAITDRDEDDILNTMDADPWVDHGNNVFSFAIPVPTFRQDDPAISIEQMFTDETMKTMVKCEDGISRRLYTSDEFDDLGRCVTAGFPYTARGNVTAKGHIKVIDGGNIKLFSSDLNSETNYALSKISYARAISSKQVSLSGEDLKSFIPIFKKIQGILGSINK